MMSESWWRKVTARRRAVSLFVALLSLAGIAVVTLFPDRDAGGTPGPTCFYCDTFATLDVILNVALFLPLGAALRGFGWSWLRSLSSILALTLVIEILQFELISGRDANVRDLVANILGAALGAWLGGQWRSLVNVSPARARLFVAAGSVVLLAFLALVSWSWRPSYPNSLYYAQWAPDRGQRSVFAGHVLDASAARHAAPQGPLAASSAVRAAMAASGSRLSVRAVLSDPPPTPAPIFAIFDDERRMIAELAQSKGRLSFDLRQNADMMRLRKPTYRLDAERFLIRDATVAVEGALDGGAVRIAVVAKSGSASGVVRLTPGLGWTLFMPFSAPTGGAASLVSALWLAALFMPLGYWNGRATARGVWLGITLLGGFVAAPIAFGAAVAGVSDWLGALAGALIGVAAGRRSP
jgi:hypothetical protein